MQFTAKVREVGKTVRLIKVGDIIATGDGHGERVARISEGRAIGVGFSPRFSFFAKDGSLIASGTANATAKVLVAQLVEA